MVENSLNGLLQTLIIWAKRATGIGYRRFGPLVGNEIDVDKARHLRVKSDKLVHDVEQLELELRKIGFRVPPIRRSRN